MIRAYPRDVTVEAGGTLVLHVATSAARYAASFVRVGATHDFAYGVSLSPNEAPQRYWFDGRDAAPGSCDSPWSWPAYDFPVPASWRSGAYVAMFETEAEVAAHAQRPALGLVDARSHAALFVVRTPRIAPIALNLPLFTYHAYNIANVDGTAGDSEGECLYSGPRAVTLHRPGGGTGGHLWDEVHRDMYDAVTPRQSFSHWDAKALQWLERSGYAVDVVTDLDLHEGAALNGRRLLLAFGHQEYWTREMRESVERHTARGGNVAFFSGNTSFFRVLYDASRRAIVRDGKWNDDDPEERFTGASYRFGGGRWRGARPSTGYVVRDAAHWVFAGTELRDGDAFGEAERLVGYECDGPAPGNAAEVLADASLAQWPTDECGEALGEAAAMTLMPLGRGQVFNAGTVDWSRVLAAGHAAVERITRNVIDRFAAS